MEIWGAVVPPNLERAQCRSDTAKFGSKKPQKCGVFKKSETEGILVLRSHGKNIPALWLKPDMELEIETPKSGITARAEGGFTHGGGSSHPTFPHS